MIVYHGSTEIVKKPDDRHSYRALDFGSISNTAPERIEIQFMRKSNYLWNYYKGWW